LNDIATTYNKVNLVIEKGYSINDNPNNVEKTLIYPVAQEDKDALESVYDGKYYPLYSVPLMCYEYSLEFGLQVNFTNESSIYVPSGLGVSVVDNDFLSDRFNNIELAAGSLYKIEESNKLIITDYLADSFIYFNSALKSEDPNDPYQVILSNMVGEGAQRYQIGAIINTHYKERYNVIFESLDYISSHPDRATEIATEVYSSKIYSIFKDEIFSSLAIGYSLNPNYIEEYKHNVLHGFFRTGYMYYDNDFNNPIYKIERIAIFVDPTILEDDQIRISPSILPKIQTSISALSNDEINIDDGIDVTIANYQYNQKQGDDPVMQENVTIINTYDTGYQYDAIYVSRGLMNKIIEDQVVEYGFILDEKDDAVAINKILKSKMYYSDSTLFTTLFSLVNITEIFTSIFTIVAVFLIVILAVIVISHNTRIIKHERYRIGIYKALGCSDISLSQSLVIASLITVIAILSLSIPFSYITAYLSNELMKFSFSKFLSSSIYSQITIISFDLVPVLIFNGIVFAITLFSSFIPFMLIKNIKPNQILRKVDD